MGFKHGQYLKYGQGNNKHQATAGISSDAGWRGEMNFSELPTANLYLTMLRKLGIEAKSFAGSTKTLSEV
jgi:hypothetical protein